MVSSRYIRRVVDGWVGLLVVAEVLLTSLISESLGLALAIRALSVSYSSI